MRELNVKLGANSYPILIGDGLDASLLREQMGERHCVCMVDSNVAALHADRLDALFPGLARIEVPAGEGSKRLALLESCAERLLELGLGRDGLLVAVGGGVTGDLTGFLAASYLRGIPFLQVPTTLLAQVDASVGGKVAVNLPGAKNSLGFFHQPEAVFVELGFLATLPRRELAAGLAEMLKMGAILDAAYLDALEASGAALMDGAPAELEAAVAACCALKAGIVARDERESGTRQLLNFGHTLAHAIEGYSPRPDLLHGEAVAVGMCFALALGEGIGVTRQGCAARLAALLPRLGLPTRVPRGLSARALRAGMDTDKKRRRGELRLVLLQDWGEACYGEVVAEEPLLAALASFCDTP